MTPGITEYLRTLERAMRARGLFDAETLAEIADHLEESVDANMRRGMSRTDAEADALRRFGSPSLVASTFERVRTGAAQTVILVIGLVAGLFIAYVDALPTWDDTGISAGVVLLTTGLLALLGHRRPWLLALAVSGWIPLHGVLVSHNLGSLLALAFAFAGATAGRLCRRAIVGILHPA